MNQTPFSLDSPLLAFPPFNCKHFEVRLKIYITFYSLTISIFSFLAKSFLVNISHNYLSHCNFLATQFSQWPRMKIGKGGKWKWGLSFSCFVWRANQEIIATGAKRNPAQNINPKSLLKQTNKETGEKNKRQIKVSNVNMQSNKRFVDLLF
jgi:hypothetical protein